MFQRAFVHMSKRGKGMPSLAYFIETSKAKALWRFIVRRVYKLPDPVQRRELLLWAKQDFERHKNETDVERIKYLVASGTKEAHNTLKMMQLM